MMCVSIALVVAICAALVGVVQGADRITMIVEFVVGFFFALILASNIFGILGSAVESIIVLYAEAPAELEVNHPELAMDMKNTWHAAWPDVFTVGVVAPMAAAAVLPETSLPGVV
jgi:hypothetical protein